MFTQTKCHTPRLNNWVQQTGDCIEELDSPNPNPNPSYLFTCSPFLGCLCFSVLQSFQSRCLSLGEWGYISQTHTHACTHARTHVHTHTRTLLTDQQGPQDIKELTQSSTPKERKVKACVKTCNLLCVGYAHRYINTDKS